MKSIVRRFNALGDTLKIFLVCFTFYLVTKILKN